MVDFSQLFIWFEFLKELPFVSALFHSTNFAIFTAVLALIFVLVSFCVPLQKDTTKISGKRFFFGIGVVLALICVLNILYLYAPQFLFYLSNLTGYDGDALFFFILLPCGLIAILLCFCLGLRQSKEPNNSSQLNQRQLLFVLGWLFFALLLLILLHRHVFVVYKPLITVLLITAEIASLVFWLYDPIILFLSRIIKTRHQAVLEPSPGKLNRLAVLGCAHNESAVIDQLIKSVYANTYPRDRYDLYIICDNCTDNTAEIVKQCGAIPMVRETVDERGKGFALKWMFAKLEDMAAAGKKYDAYIVLDADNIINEKYLEIVSDKLNEGYEILQTYLGCKNPADSWISKCYSLAYWLSNVSFQKAHSDLGLSAQMGGTGMVIRPQVLKDIGWETDSLTEDLVLTTRYVLAKNKSCAWIHEARLYDEKPTQLKPSTKQRTRWMQGHMDAMIKFAPKLLLAAIKNRSFRQFDMAFYLMRPMINLCLIACYVFRWSTLMLFPDIYVDVPSLMSLVMAIVLVSGYLLLQLGILIKEHYIRYFFWIPLQWIFTFSWYPPIFRGLIKHKERYWVSTVHSRNIAIAEVREDVEITEAQHRLEGLDNLHRLPLGQILLKAAVVSNTQLEEALNIQKNQGGYLGDIIVHMNALSSETLKAYLSIQEEMKQKAQEEGRPDEHLQLGNILIEAGIITKSQLYMALAYQAEHGGYLGECLIQTGCLAEELLDVFLKMQKVFDINFISSNNAGHFIDGVLGKKTENIGAMLLSGGFISHTQLDLATAIQEAQGGYLGQILVNEGFVNQDILDIILSVQSAARKHSLGTVLLRGGIINQAQLDEAIKYQQEHGGMIGQILINLGYVLQQDLDIILALQTELRNQTDIQNL